MRKLFIAGNWKMNKTIKEGRELVNALKRDLYEVQGVDIAVCPPYTLLAELADMLAESNIGLGAQDVFWLDEGAYTGEVSGRMLGDAGCRYVIIGHSERRQYFGETNESVNKKIKAALNNELTPIVCVGESLQEREAGKTFSVLDDHINNGLAGLGKGDVSLNSGNVPFSVLTIAYEPVWAIGTGATATAAEAQEAHKYIRGLLGKLFGAETADTIRIQYGGSVKPENTKELMSMPDVDGALVGGASLKAELFVDIVRKAAIINK